MTPLMQALREELRSVRMLKNSPQFAHEYDTFAKIIADVRYRLAYVREELAAQEAQLEKVEIDPRTTIASYDEIVSTLGIAARARGQYGATSAQIRYLAELYVKAEATLHDIAMTTLTKREASILIEDAKKRI